MISCFLVETAPVFVEPIIEKYFPQISQMTQNNFSVSLLAPCSLRFIFRGAVTYFSKASNNVVASSGLMTPCSTIFRILICSSWVAFLGGASLLVAVRP